MTEDPYYTYNPEEETTPRRNNGKLFTGLMMGLLIGGMTGYLLGSQNVPSLPTLDSGAAPPFFLSINAAIIFILFVFLLSNRIKRTAVNRSMDTLTTRKLLILIMGLLVFLAAGIYAFFAS